jgi:hypothetical protein
MADLKISALPSASTPLAGTELVPIVQGGITEQVTVANLTAGRAVSAASLALTTTPLPVGSGGTGLTTLAASRVPYGNGTGAFSNVSGFYFSTTGWLTDYAVGVEGGSSAAIVLTCGGAYSGAGIRVTSAALAAVFAGGADRTYTTSNSYYAATDNAYTLGTAGNRWSVVYAATGAINTSDERYKQDIRDLSEAEKLTAQDVKKLLKAFRFKDAVQEKGDKARIHFGVIAQEVQAAFVKNGLNPENYGLFCYDKWEDEFETIYRTEVIVDADGNEKTNHIDTGEKKQTQVAGDRFGIRYEELFAFVISTL